MVDAYVWDICNSVAHVYFVVREGWLVQILLSLYLGSRFLIFAIEQLVDSGAARI